MLSSLEIAKTLYKTPALVSHRVRCGKPTCHCANGEGHGPYAFLHWRDGTIQRRRYVRQADVDAVHAVIVSRQAEDRGWRVALTLAAAHHREVKRWLRDLHAS